MAFYSSNVEQKLKTMKFLPNILEEYDNYTYNVRFYLIPKSYQHMLHQKRINSKSVDIPIDKKVIIYESGVSSNYNLQDLNLSTTFNRKNAALNCITTEIKMTLKEINDCALSNKISVISSVLGYDSYIRTPFHIDIWFSGYDHITKKPIRCINDKVYTFEVIIGEVKSSVNDTGTDWTFNMTPTYHIALDKEINILMNTGMITSQVGTLEEIRSQIEKTVNDHYFENNKHLASKYSDSKYLDIAITDLSNVSLENLSMVNGEYRKNLSKLNEINVSNNQSPKSSASSTQIDIKPDKSITLNNIFQEIVRKTPEFKNCVAISTYQAEPFDNYDNQELYKIHMNVVILREPFLSLWENYMKNKGKMPKEQIEKMQMEALDLMKLEGTLLKKYQLGFNGEDTSVLEMKTNIDNLWYLNIGFNDIISEVNASKDNSMKTELSLGEMFETETLSYDERLAKISDNIDMSLHWIKRLTKDGRIYVDDIYNALSSNQRVEILKNRPILFKQDIFSDTTNSSMDNNDIKNIDDYQIAKIGYTNLYGSGNFIENRIDIIGDPYWIQIPSDEAIYSPSIIPQHSLMYHYYFNMKTGIYADNKSYTGGNSIENAKDFSGIYTILVVKSSFSEGKFTQELYGVIDKRFMFSTFVKV